jgi:hypothetical protein
VEGVGEVMELVDRSGWTAAQTEFRPQPVPDGRSARLSLCLYLGRLEERADCICPGKHWYACENPEKSGYRVCRPGIECQGCTAYEADA